MKRYVPLGTTIAVLMVGYMVAAWTSPGTLLYALVHDGGIVARIGSIVVGVLYAGVLLDLAAGARVTGERAARILSWLRLRAWALLAMAHGSQAWVAVRMQLRWPLVFVFVVAGVACLWCLGLEQRDLHYERLRRAARRGSGA